MPSTEPGQGVSDNTERSHHCPAWIVRPSVGWRTAPATPRDAGRPSPAGRPSVGVGPGHSVEATEPAIARAELQASFIGIVETHVLHLPAGCGSGPAVLGQPGE